jgi:hypothetical protein
MASVIADTGRSRIAVGDWSRRVEGLEVRDDQAEARLGLPKGFVLHLEWRPGGDQLSVSLWAPDRERAAAVVVDEDGPAWLTAVPVCGCGELGCSNVSFGFCTTIVAEELPPLVDMLQGLPIRDATLAVLEGLPLWDGALAPGD